MRLAVFISGTGRSLQNLIECSKTTHKETFEIVCVASDNIFAPGLQYARTARIDNFVASEGLPERRDDLLLQFAFTHHVVDYICLAGYIKKLSIPPEHQYKVINIHPSLIPKFCGQGMYGSKVHQCVIKAKEQESGCTVHFCDNEYDHGPIILQKKLIIDPSWDYQNLATEVFKLEKEAYPEALTFLKTGEQ